MQLSADNFARKLKETPTAVIVDVRTLQEFSKGHLEDALNINWKVNALPVLHLYKNGKRV